MTVLSRRSVLRTSLAAVAAGNDDDEVSLEGLTGVVVKPAAHPGKIEVGLPSEEQITHPGILRACPFDQFSIVAQEMMAQKIEVTAMVDEMFLGSSVQHAVCSILGEITALGERRYRFPKAHFKRAPGCAVISHGGRQGCWSVDKDGA